MTDPIYLSPTHEVLCNPRTLLDRILFPSMRKAYEDGWRDAQEASA